MDRLAAGRAAEPVDKVVLGEAASVGALLVVKVVSLHAGHVGVVGGVPVKRGRGYTSG